MSDVIHLCVILHICFWAHTGNVQHLPWGQIKRKSFFPPLIGLNDAKQVRFFKKEKKSCSVKFKVKKELKLNLWQRLLLKRPPISKKRCSPGDFAYIFNANSCQYWYYVLTVRGIKMILSTWGDSIDTSDYT